MIYRLENSIRHYCWGSKTFIPELMGKNTTPDEPCAELWMGAHPRSPSRIITSEGESPLSQLISQDPVAVLGTQRNQALPFLLKVLAADRPLSIQAHPGIKQAREGFADENAAGVHLDSFQRNYKDPNHKPELICALTPFDVLCGFRKFDQIAELIYHLDLDLIIPEISVFLTAPNSKSFRLFFYNLMSLAGQEKSDFLNLLFRKINMKKSRSKEEEIAFDWVIRLMEIYPDDIGACAPIILNTARLQPGEALYIDSGILHSYLNGAGIEIMANSDNVLRGGLTVKHVDVDELMKTLKFNESIPRIIRPETTDNIEFIYSTTAREFRLSRIELDYSVLFNPKTRTGAEIILSVNGTSEVIFGPGEQKLLLSKGESVFIPFYTGAYTIQGKTILYRATIP